MISIYLFGHLRLVADGTPLPFRALPKTVSLLAYLLLNRDRPIPRDYLAGILWDEVPTPEAQSNLRRHLHDLQRVLPAPPPGYEWITRGHRGVQWSPEAPCWLDVAEFERLSTDPEGLAEAVALYTDDLLPALYDDWSQMERERLSRLYVNNLTRLAQRCAVAGDYLAALGFARQVLARDPLNEASARHVMALCYAAGDRAGAVQEYQRVADRLQQELAVKPLPETEAVYRAIRSGGPLPEGLVPVARHSDEYRTGAIDRGSTDGTAGHLGAVRGIPHNLPSQLTSFVGRASELAAIEALVAPSSAAVRLVTLTGPGGAGKTRLSLEAAERLKRLEPHRFPDGVFFVALAAIEDAGHVISAIAASVGVQEHPAQPLDQRLAESLAEKRLLVVLDNFEQVQAASSLVAELLARVPGLTVLATSRAPLGIYGEHELPVDTLPLPETGTVGLAAPLVKPGSLDAVAVAPAIALYCDRARAVNPSFSLTEHNAGAVVALCRRLDGLPLALELAAAHIRFLSPEAFLVRLEQGMSMASRAQDRPARHQTLFSLVAWSYRLLSPAERQLYARLAVFAGTFSVEAVAAIAAADGLNVDGEEDSQAAEAGDVLALLASLADKSMIRIKQPVDEAALPRFDMLATLRDFALDRLTASGEVETLRRRHADYFLQVADQSRAALWTAEQATQLAALAQDHANLRAALSWAIGAGNADRALRLASGLEDYWRLAGHVSEGRRWLDQALALESSAASPWRARGWQAAGFLALHNMQLSVAHEFFGKALAHFEESGDRLEAAWTLRGMGQTEEDRALADANLKRSLAEFEAVGDEPRQASVLHAMGLLAFWHDDLEAARRFYDESLAISQRNGLLWNIRITTNNLAQVTAAQGDFESAYHLHLENLARWREFGTPDLIALCLFNLGSASTRRGDLAGAEDWLRQSLRLNDDLGLKLGVFACLSELAFSAAGRDDYDRTARLFGAADALLSTLGMDAEAHWSHAECADYVQSMAAARAALGDAAYEAARAAGRAMTLDQAVAVGLERID